MNEELVSVIMPVFNDEQYLEEAIQSMKKQTYTNWELICINDASEDNSLNILAKNKSDKIKIISMQKNSGSALARNEGIKIAKGRFIAYLDADDNYNENKLKKQVEFMQKNNYAITYTDYAFVYKNGKIKNVKVPKELTYTKYLKNTMITSVGVMIDTNKINKQNLYMENRKLAEDTKTWVKILKHGVTAYGLNEVLGYYRQGKNSKSNNKLKAAKAMWEIYKEENIPIIKSCYYFLCYSYNAIKKRVNYK